MFFFQRALAVGIACASVSCALDRESFQTLGDRVVHPSAITHDGKWFYVVNSDMERQYNAGSILTIDKNGEKRGVISTPRVGRFIVYRRPYLMVGHSPTDQYKTPPQLRIYDARSPTELKLHQQLTLSCHPVNAVAPAGYNYFAISCDSGEIYMGYFTQSSGGLAKARIHLVRDYGPHARRALYIDTRQHHLYAFSTDWQRSEFRDAELEDALSYSYEPVEEPIKGPVDFTGTIRSSTQRDAAPEYSLNRPNEIPDNWEILTQLTTQEKHRLMSEYQFAVLDISKLVEDRFAFESRLSEQATQELRWLYFHTTEASGTTKHYRSNFWEVLPDPAHSKKFYISQRGVQDPRFNPDANAIYQVEITGSPFSGSGKPRKTQNFLKFQKVWGYKSSAEMYARSLRNPAVRHGPYSNARIRFTGNFVASRVRNFPYFLINDFRDPALFSNNAYSLTLTSRDSGSSKPSSDDMLVFSDRSRSYFAISAMDSAVLAGAFYTDTLSLFKITEAEKLQFVKDIH